jgi:hypothetical protein
MPNFANMPFSLATNSGAASVSAMKPSVAFFTSGPAACATCAPPGNASRTASINATVDNVAAARLSNARRESRRVGKEEDSVMIAPVHGDGANVDELRFASRDRRQVHHCSCWAAAAIPSFSQCLPKAHAPLPRG